VSTPKEPPYTLVSFDTVTNVGPEITIYAVPAASRPVDGMTEEQALAASVAAPMVIGPDDFDHDW
jgi:hypothetical protein